MSIRVGLIGLGAMGSTHLRLLATEIAGARVTTVCDADPARAEAEGARFDARATTEPLALIGRDDVDAVLVASPDRTHAACVMACLEAGKPVLCEKPLADSVEACRRIVAREAELPRPLVQLGFMRRFDPSYQRLRAALDAGEAGEAALLRCVHRNATSPGFFDLSMTLANAMVHDFDIARWLLGTEITRIRVDQPTNARGAPRPDPLLATLATSAGTLVSIEVFMNARYGYDIRAEIVGRDGTLEMRAPACEVARRDGREGFAHAADFNERFADAYRRQSQAWIAALVRGETIAPGAATARDGLTALEIAAAGERALATGGWIDMSEPARAAS